MKRYAPFLTGFVVGTLFTVGMCVALKPAQIPNRLPEAVKLDPSSLQLGMKVYENGQYIGLLCNLGNDSDHQVGVQIPSGAVRVIRKFDFLTSGQYKVEL